MATTWMVGSNIKILINPISYGIIVAKQVNSQKNAMHTGSWLPYTEYYILEKGILRGISVSSGK